MTRLSLYMNHMVVGLVTLKITTGAPSCNKTVRLLDPLSFVERDLQESKVAIVVLLSLY